MAFQTWITKFFGDFIPDILAELIGFRYLMRNRAPIMAQSQPQGEASAAKDAKQAIGAIKTGAFNREDDAMFFALLTEIEDTHIRAVWHDTMVEITREGKEQELFKLLALFPVDDQGKRPLAKKFLEQLARDEFPKHAVKNPVGFTVDLVSTGTDEEKREVQIKGFVKKLRDQSILAPTIIDRFKRATTIKISRAQLDAIKKVVSAMDNASAQHAVPTLTAVVTRIRPTPPKRWSWAWFRYLFRLTTWRITDMCGDRFNRLNQWAERSTRWLTH